MPITIATYNILNPYHAVKWAVPIGLNDLGKDLPPESLKREATHGNWRPYSNWEERKHLVAKSILQADIVCLQEVSDETVQDLQELGVNIPIFASHQEAGEGETHGNAIAYRPDLAKFINGDSIQFNVNDHYRQAAVALFEVEETRLLVASVHLKGFPPRADYDGPIEEVKQVGYDELLEYVDKIKEKESDYIIIGGDFNEDWRDESKPNRRGILREMGFMTDNSTNETELGQNCRLDWVFVKSQKGQEPEISHVPFELTLPPSSDHLMTGLSLMLNR